MYLLSTIPISSPHPLVLTSILSLPMSQRGKVDRNIGTLKLDKIDVYWEVFVSFCLKSVHETGEDVQECVEALTICRHWSDVVPIRILVIQTAGLVSLTNKPIGSTIPDIFMSSVKHQYINWRSRIVFAPLQLRDCVLSCH